MYDYLLVDTCPFQGVFMKVDIQRVSVETVVDRYIRDIKKDPKRGIRNLIDFGAEFSRGRFQKQFFHLSRKLMDDEKNTYYDLGKRLVLNVDAEKIKGFGINMGLNALTRGAGEIRLREKKEGYNIPWSLALHVDAAGLLTPERVERLVREGMEEGIYAYHIFIRDAAVPLAGLMAVMSRCDRCAFIVHVPPQLVREGSAGDFAALKNAAFSVYMEEDTGRAVELLRENRCVCSLTVLYGQREAEGILQKEFLALPYLKDCFFAVFAAKEECPLYLCEAVRETVRSVRDSRNPPLFLVDFYSDCLYVDEIISDDTCFLGILPDGTVTRCENLREIPTGQSLRDKSLREILMKHKPKTMTS